MSNKQQGMATSSLQSGGQGPTEEQGVSATQGKRKGTKGTKGSVSTPRKSSIELAPNYAYRWILFLFLLMGLVGGGFAVFQLLLGDEGSKDDPEVTAIRVEDRGEAPPGMVWVPSGAFRMGASHEERFADATPVHEVELNGFWIDRTEVTNAQFKKFVDETGYVTVAERKPDPREFPGVPAERLVPFSLVFTPPKEGKPLRGERSWWSPVPGASWQHPEGPGSSIQDRMDHPVVHVCWHDAMAYATWAKKRLPTEAEWEYAARGGLDRKRYVWGDELLPGGEWQSNIWQGNFPVHNEKKDGHVRTAPVGSFPPNGYGIYEMSGNVWEWCSDWYRPDYYLKSPKKNPKGPKDSFDPREPHIPKKVQRGGSFLCSDGFCIRYLPAGRGKGDLNSGASHIGFRCVKSPE